MNDERLTIPIDDAYVHAVGLATICFARLEWNAVWCCEKMHVGYVHTVATKTAGQIANDLLSLAWAHPDPNVVAMYVSRDNYCKLFSKEDGLCCRQHRSMTSMSGCFTDGRIDRLERPLTAISSPKVLFRSVV